jgi:23S rRNA (adenine-N6)-dimethyltransferase
VFAARSARQRPRSPRRLNPPGLHLLADQVAARLVSAALVHPDDLVFDLGAGAGALTEPLARTGARIIAVERDPRLARRLAARVGAYPNVRVVTADALTVPMPARPYRVVANIPFGITTALVRRLVDTPLATAHLVVEAAAARRFAAARPARRELVEWQVRFGFEVVRQISARHFVPPPPVDAAVLRLVRHDRPPPGVERLISYAYRTPGAPVGRIVGRTAARRAGVDPHAPVADVTAAAWRALAG